MLPKKFFLPQGWLPRSERNMLTWLIVILLILWLLGYFGPIVSTGIPNTGNALHILLVIVVILIILRVL